MQTFKKLLFILTPAERKQSDLKLTMSIIITLLDIINLGFVMSFIEVPTNSHTSETSTILNSACMKTQVT